MSNLAFDELDLRIDDLAPNGVELSEDELRAVSGGQENWRRTNWQGWLDYTTGSGAYS